MKQTVLFLFILIMVSSVASAATVHGAIFNEDLQQITDVQLVINTTPKQNHVSKNGAYFFFAPVGTYEITAERSYQNQTVYIAKQKVEIDNDAEYQIDIVMEKIADIEIPGLTPPEETIWTFIRSRYKLILYATIALAALVAASGAFYYLYSRRNHFSISLDKEHTELPKDVHAIETTVTVDQPDERAPTPISVASMEQSMDIEGVIKIIRDEGGRTTQKEIRKKLPLSEAKVSLMISELEAKGMIEKIKKGRGNLIILK